MVTGRSPELVVNSPLDFGNVPVGSQQAGKLIITNGGDAPLVIDEIQMDAVNPAFKSVSRDTVTITASGLRACDRLYAHLRRALSNGTLCVEPQRR